MLKIVYMGTPDFAVPALKKIAEKHEVGYVLTQEDKPKNRGKKMLPTPVKEAALELGIEVLQPHRVRGDEELLEKLKAYAPDVIVVAAYGQILPKDVLDVPKFGCFNIHASLLPRHRGAAPIQQVILDGDEYAGVTIMMMEEGLDTGDMILKGKTPVLKKTTPELTEELSEIGSDLMMKVLEMIDNGEDLDPEKQDDSLSTYAHMISKQDGKIDWNQDAASIERRIRAMDPWPGAFTEYMGETLKIWEADIDEEISQSECGTITEVSPDGIRIAAKEGTLIAKVIQMPGKKRVAVKEFLKGNSIEKGTVLR